MSQEVAKEKALEALAVARNAFTEVRYDTAVDRAYFAMFHAARAALQMIAGIDTTSLTSHKAVLVSFSELLVKPGTVAPRLGGMINAVQRLRHVSDYSDRHVSKDEALQSIEAAEEVCGIVLKLTTSDTGTQ